MRIRQMPLKFKILGECSTGIILSDRFNKYIYKELQTPLQINQLIGRKSSAIVPVVYHRSEEQKTIVIHDYYESTLCDLWHHEFDQDEIINTVQLLVKQLKVIYDSGIQYGMVSKHNITYFQNQIKLTIGNPQYEKIKTETYFEYDLRSVGNMILELLNVNIQQDLATLKTRYPTLCEIIQCLTNKASADRILVFKYFEPDIVVKVEHPKSKLLGEVNNRYDFEYFENKIEKIDQLVDECLKRSKRLIEKSQNNRIK